MPTPCPSSGLTGACPCFTCTLYGLVHDTVDADPTPGSIDDILHGLLAVMSSILAGNPDAAGRDLTVRHIAGSLPKLVGYAHAQWLESNPEFRAAVVSDAMAEATTAVKH